MPMSYRGLGLTNNTKKQCQGKSFLKILSKVEILNSFRKLNFDSPFHETFRTNQDRSVSPFRTKQHNSKMAKKEILMLNYKI